MNNQRRTELNKIVSRLGSIKNELDNIKSDEEWAFDSMPENLQYSERGEISQEAIEAMDEALESIEEALNHIEEAMS